MASNDQQNKATPDTSTKEKFNFGEYVSPNPKPIPFGIKYKPDPLIKIIHKTDSKIETIPTTKEEAENLKNETKDNPYLDQKIMDEQKDKFSVQNNKEFEYRHKVKKSESTPLKVKVSKQQKEINFLQSELLKLRLELQKSKSSTASPANEEIKLEKSTKQSTKHIVFDENVQIMDEASNEQDSFLNDSVSKVRSTRNSTPFKGKLKEKPTIFIKKNNQAQAQKKGRGDYRITPVPQKKPRRVVFKSRLKSICDKTPNNKENISIAENEATPKEVNKKMATPKVEIVSNANSFNLGQKVCSSASTTPSFLETPDVIDSTQLTVTGNGASNVVSPSSPILTPVKGMENNSKRFEFSWNKQQRR